MPQSIRSHSSHWGAYEPTVEDGAVVDVRPFSGDSSPSELLGNIASTVRHRSRIAVPMVRSGWLERGPGSDSRRGSDSFVQVSWEEVADLLSAELKSVTERHGSGAIYGGSYGWASAGRFHHAQSQIHRFLNLIGGYVSSVDTYSNAAGDVILRRVLGDMRELLFNRATAWSQIVANTDLIVAFGGIPLKNSSVSPGGQSRHNVPDQLGAGRDAGIEYVLFSPIRDDIPEFVRPEWHPLRPGTDVAVMLGLAHTLVSEGLHDRAFLDRYCAGYERFERYLLGLDDGYPKHAEWAAHISEVSPEAIRTLARRMAGGRTLINVTWSLQRADHGEQPPWMGLTLAAMLGQIGLPGGGYGFGYGSIGFIGDAPLKSRVPYLRQGRNPVREFIPVARVADMLLHPGEPFDYDGQRLTYPEIKVVYWAGGNPFHHHQNIPRLRRAFARPDTIVVHDPYWTATARHADIVIPSTISLERDDIGAASTDHTMVAMKQAVAPFAASRNDFDFLTDLAERFGVADAFTEGRTSSEWIEHLYEEWRCSISAVAQDLPCFDEFWERGFLDLQHLDRDLVALESFRKDPVAGPLATPSGRIEIFSETIERFGYDDCPGHPVWLEPREWLGGEARQAFPLQLIANNPATRLHSQLDPGDHSQASKIRGREPVRIHPADAAARGVTSGDIVRLYNDRGSCLAGAIVSESVRLGVVQLSTGAWYDPLDPGDPDSVCVHGNPNMLTFDKGTSRFGQGCSGQLSLIELERFVGELPPIRAYDPPPIRADVRLPEKGT